LLLPISFCAVPLIVGDVLLVLMFKTVGVSGAAVLIFKPLVVSTAMLPAVS
jgi:hypothetical protein